jgi:hypothetical protein
MGEKGEFEQRPEVKPASSIPLPKEKASPAIKILCVIFALVALGLGGFIVYDKLVTKDGDVRECTEAADEPGEIAEGDGEGDDEGDEDVDGGDVKDTSAKGFAKYAEYGNYYVTKNGDVYLEPMEGTIHVGSLTINNIAFDKNEKFGKYGTYTITNKDLVGYNFAIDSFESSNSSITIKGFKLDLTNVVSMYEPVFGQSWNGWDMAFIDKSGKLSWLYIMPDFLTNTNAVKTKLTKNVKGYTDAVSIMEAWQPDGRTVIVVTKDGGHIEMSLDELVELETIK